MTNGGQNDTGLQPVVTGAAYAAHGGSGSVRPTVNPEAPMASSPDSPSHRGFARAQSGASDAQSSQGPKDGAGRQNLADLSGKRGLVVGVANDHSIAAGCARAFRAAGAELALSYLNAAAKPYVQPVADAVAAEIFLPCDVREPGQLEVLFDAIETTWGRLDFLLHSIAFAPREDLHTSVVNASAAGFAMAMDISCHSFLRMARLARPLMVDGGALLTVSYYGADRVVENYNLMGPVKAALEASVRYAAADLAPDKIRAFALSAGPVMTRAASGIARFDELIDRVQDRTPSHHLVSVEEIGRIAAFLASEAASPMSGSVIYADNSFHVMA